MLQVAELYREHFNSNFFEATSWLDLSSYIEVFWRDPSLLGMSINCAQAKNPVCSIPSPPREKANTQPSKMASVNTDIGRKVRFLASHAKSYYYPAVDSSIAAM